MSVDKLLRRTLRLLADVRCDSTGCYAATGHREACIRGRAEKLAEEIAAELERRRQMGVPQEIGL